MNVIAPTTSKLRILSLVTFACLTAACSSDVLGTGGVRQAVPESEGNGGTTGESSGSGTGSASASGTASGAPAEIEALFAPPETDTVTPGSIFGLWASGDGGTEDRLQITKTSVTLARKCSLDGRIAHVTAKVRVTETGITVLESKSAQLTSLPNASKGTCTFQLRLDVEEWRRCSSDPYDNDCFRVEGTKLTGLVLPSTFSDDEWIKLSD